MFNKNWFIQNQTLLKWFANTNYGKGVLGHDLDRVDLILPNAVFRQIGENEVKAEFRTHEKYGKRLFYEYKAIWDAFHWFDMNIANIYVPKLNLGFDELTFYPDAGTGSTTVDGYVGRDTVDEAFATIRAGAGNQEDDTGSTMYARLNASATNNQFSALNRWIDLFDTSALGGSATVSAATISHYGSASNNEMASSLALHIGASTPASDNILVVADYGQTGTTSFGNVVFASYSTSAYNDIELNEDGISNIDTTGISKFSGKTSWDINNSAPTWVSGKNDYFACKSADTAGTTDDPKLVVTYTAPTAGLDLTSKSW